MINERGYWLEKNSHEHKYDLPLNQELTKILKEVNCKSIVDLGCGPGLYAKSFIVSNFDCECYDGNPHTPDETDNLCSILVIFNNLLQSLFDSQIKTLGITFAGIFILLLILFKSLSWSIVAAIPNFTAALFILGSLGLFNIPLDMMTITIASITVGIAIDNSIHYIYRFREEYKLNKNYKKTIEICHKSVGKAIVNASLTIVFGFSILIFSNFIPSIYFGIFTGLAMLTAMTLVLTLMPQLIAIIKPFKNG